MTDQEKQQRRFEILREHQVGQVSLDTTRALIADWRDKLMDIAPGDTDFEILAKEFAFMIVATVESAREALLKVAGMERMLKTFEQAVADLEKELALRNRILQGPSNN